MKYFRAYQFIFDSSNWFVNLLIGIVCSFVPIAGQMVLIGYGFEIIEAKHRRGDVGYPDFDFNRLLKYFLRGVWPFLVQFVIVFPVGMVLGVLFVVVVMGTAIASGDNMGAVGFIVIVLSMFMLMILSLLLQMAVIPLVLRAGLTQDFRSAFSLAFFRDFLQRTWREMLLSTLFLVGSGLVLMLAGALLCCVGTYPAQAWLVFAQFHITYQLYALYLQRGGMQVPLKLEAALDTDIQAADDAGW